MKKKLLYITLTFLSCFYLSACQEDPEPGGTATQDVAGEWWVTYQVADAAGNLEDVGQGYYKFTTFNTAANLPTEMWISDLLHLKEFQVKVNLDKSSNTFSANQAQNLLYPERTLIFNKQEPKKIDASFPGKVTVENAKILLGQGLSTTKVKTDSIYMELLFDDDTTATGEPYDVRWVVSGHRRTGFLEDEHE